MRDLSLSFFFLEVYTGCRRIVFDHCKTVEFVVWVWTKKVFSVILKESFIKSIFWVTRYSIPFEESERSSFSGNQNTPVPTPTNVLFSFSLFLRSIIDEWTSGVGRTRGREVSSTWGGRRPFLVRLGPTYTGRYRKGEYFEVGPVLTAEWIFCCL